MNDPTEVCQHKWTDVYNGTKCQLCETFYPFGCAPIEGRNGVISALAKDSP